MSLAVGRVHARFTTSRPRDVRPLLADWSDTPRLAAASARALAPVWPAHRGVCRIRRLPLQLTLRGSELDRETFARAWATAFAEALRRALVRPEGLPGLDLVRVESRAAWLARALVDLVDDTARGRWEYEEFHAVLERPFGEAVLALLASAPAEVVPTLVALQARGALDRLLARLDDLALERLFVLVADVVGVAEVRLDVPGALAVARAAVAHAGALAGDGLDGRRSALRLFVALAREGGLDRVTPRTPREVYLTLAALMALLRVVGDAVPTPERLAAILGRRPADGWHPAVATLLERIAALAAPAAGPAGQRTRRAVEALIAALVELQQALPAAARPALDRPSRRFVSDYAGLLLLAGTLERLAWPEALLGARVVAEDPRRRRTALLAALGLAALGRLDAASIALEPAVALFAGWTEEPDPGAVRRLLDGGSVEVRRELLATLAVERAAAAQDWPATLDAIADELVRHFVARVRGFRRASPAFARKHFLALPGTIDVAAEAMSVRLRPAPYLAALRVSGLDEPIAAVSWLGGRRLEIHLEGV